MTVYDVKKEALEFVRLVASHYWIHGERYEQCFFCESPFDEDKDEHGQLGHTEDCPVRKAKKLLELLGEDAEWK